jgi:hypothetical protein
MDDDKSTPSMTPNLANPFTDSDTPPPPAAKKAGKKGTKKAAKGKKPKSGKATPKPKKPLAPTVQPVLQEAESPPTEYLFDPKKPAAHEPQRDQIARHKYQIRLRRLEQARGVLEEAVKAHDQLLMYAIQHPEDDDADKNVKKAEVAVKAAQDKVTKEAADVAPKPEPWSTKTKATRTEKKKAAAAKKTAAKKKNRAAKK